MEPTALGPLRRAADRLALGMMFLGGVLYLAATLLIVGDVVARNFLGFSTRSTIELSGYFLAIGIAWSLGGVLARRAHIRVDLLVRKLPLRPRAFAHLMAFVMLGIFAGFLGYGAWLLVDESLMFNATDISALRAPLWIPQALWAGGLFFFLLCVGLRVADILLLIAAGRFDDVDRVAGSRNDMDEAEETLAALGVAGALRR
jgi:TRAP-type C4-dicarboxylate transport system permease small subunit